MVHQKIDLMIIGAQKAGTTSLKNYLNEHPEIMGHPQMEFGYFRIEEEYAEAEETVFARYFTEGKAQTAKCLVAKNVGLYNNKTALKRLYQHNPECQLIFLVRNPSERAYSAYCMERSNGLVQHDFSVLPETLNSPTKAIKEREQAVFQNFIYLGLYAQHLKNIYAIFPKSQVHIFRFTDLRKRPEIICQQIFTLLQINTNFVPQTKKVHNSTKKVKSPFFANLLLWMRQKNNPIKKITKSILPYPLFTKLAYQLIAWNRTKQKHKKMSKQMETYLQNYFLPHNNEFSQLTGIDVHDWNENKYIN